MFERRTLEFCKLIHSQAGARMLTGDSPAALAKPVAPVAVAAKGICLTVCKTFFLRTEVARFVLRFLHATMISRCF
jgi:hypothetical protein